ncbi:helix-turn-helix domain-containing protein [Sphingobacterium lactis]|uniref:helix-turn-helix domain-containing protein n=2 Tax=Sphingobacteriaceae TaxID=84566 RepID=UPI0028A0C871|nr:helix-turn-helix domain-containing protein [Sphingobacterium multivorum]
MSEKNNFGRVSIENMSRQNNVIIHTSDLIISREPIFIRDLSYDFSYPQMIESIGFTLCTKGNAKMNINLVEYEVCEKTIGIFTPNSVIQILEQSEDLQVELVYFSFDFISDIDVVSELATIVQEVEKRTCILLDDERFSELLVLHNLIVKEYEKPAMYRTEIVKSLLHTIIYQILRYYSEEQEQHKEQSYSRHEAIYKKFMSLLFQHYRSERNVQFYADQVYLSPKYFSKMIKEISGKTAGEWIDEMVLMGAKAMLKSSDLSVAQISDELNFASASFFGTYFKKLAGMTPMEYRKI